MNSYWNCLELRSGVEELMEYLHWEGYLGISMIIEMDN